MRPVLDKVAFDFDSPMKEAAFPGEVTDREKINKMREDPDLCEEVLGDVWEDVEKLIGKCKEEEIPVITVFSGMGFHCHILYQERVNPVEEISTTVNYFVEECDLKTWDRKVRGDVRRVLRVPNAQRMEKVRGTMQSAGVWTIPLSEEDVMSNTIHEILDRASSPKELEMQDRYKEENRPSMEVKEGYEVEDPESMATVDLENRDIDFEVDEDARWIVERHFEMPCMKERIMRSNPGHMIRFNFAVNMFNFGYKPEEVLNIIRGLNWIDFDEKKTRRFLKQIYSSGYSDYKCETLMRKGYCVYDQESEDYSEDPQDCPAHDWAGGSCDWK